MNPIAYAAFWRRVRQFTFFALLAGLSASAVAMGLAAATAKAPPPLAEVRGAMPTPPDAFYYCDDNRVMMIYTTSTGERLEPIYMERHC